MSFDHDKAKKDMGQLQMIVGGAPQMPRFTDGLASIIEMQKTFMAILDAKNGAQPREEAIKTMTIGLADEAFEILREQNWKPWKQPKPIDYDKLRFEVIDALHFIIEICILLNMNHEDILAIYKRKMEININRQIGGY